MAISRRITLVLAVCAASILVGCGSKEPEKTPASMNDIKLPAGQQFGYKPPTK